MKDWDNDEKTFNTRTDVLNAIRVRLKNKRSVSSLRSLTAKYDHMKLLLDSLIVKNNTCKLNLDNTLEEENEDEDIEYIFSESLVRLHSSDIENNVSPSSCSNRMKRDKYNPSAVSSELKGLITLTSPKYLSTYSPYNTGIEKDDCDDNKEQENSKNMLDFSSEDLHYFSESDDIEESTDLLGNSNNVFSSTESEILNKNDINTKENVFEIISSEIAHIESGEDFDNILNNDNFKDKIIKDKINVLVSKLVDDIFEVYNEKKV
jgi:hypothetical protein